MILATSLLVFCLLYVLSGGGVSAHVYELDSVARFQNLVQRSEDDWLVAFVAPWCQHCQALRPVWERAASRSLANSEARGDSEVKFGWLSSDDNGREGLALRYDLRSFPSILHFGAGRVAKQSTTPTIFRGDQESTDAILHFARLQSRSATIAAEKAEGHAQKKHAQTLEHQRRAEPDEVVIHPDGYPVLKSQLVEQHHQPKQQPREQDSQQQQRQEVQVQRLNFHNSLPVSVKITTLMHGRESPEGMVAAGGDLVVVGGDWNTNVHTGAVWMARPVDSTDSRIWRFTVASGSPIQHLSIALHTHREL